VSGPSGAGKTSVMQGVYRRCPVPLVRSVSATTRPPRPGESDGVDYHFLSEEEFRARQARGEFIECCEVFGQGAWYGTPRNEVANRLNAGKWVVLEIDVQGAEKVMAQYADAVTIFLQPGSLAELERRLRGRGTEDETAIQRRLAVARRELAVGDRYQYHIINDDKERAVQKISDLLSKEWEKSCHD
jgi:guanylate kinase